MRRLIYPRHKLPSFCVLAFLFISYPLRAQGTFFNKLSSTYDFDGDGLSEFLSLERSDSQARLPTATVFYEIDDMGDHTELWRFDSARPIVDGGIADMDGDGLPEIVVLMRIAGAIAGQHQEPWLYLFPWVADHFSREAAVEWSPKGIGLRPSSSTVLDMDNDGRDDLAVATGSPDRQVVLLALDPLSDPPTFRIVQSLTSSSIASGYAQLHISSIDYNHDGYADLMTVTKELDSIKIQVFENIGGTFSEGFVQRVDLTPFKGDFGVLIPGAIDEVDTDNDGIDEVLLPFSGGVALVAEAGREEVLIRPLDKEIASLFALPAEGLTTVDVNEILLARAELGITTLKARKLQLQAVEAAPAAQPAAPETLAAVTPAGKVRQLQLRALERDTLAEVVSEEPAAGAAAEVAEEAGQELVPGPQEAAEAARITEAGGPPTEAEAAITPVAPKKVRKLQLTSVEREEPAAGLAILDTLPPGATVADTVPAGETFTYPLVTEEGKRLHAFQPSSLPAGASFDPTTRSIVWTPRTDQIGYHKLAYVVEYELAGEVDIEEVEATSLQVVTKTESESVELYILVTSP